MPGNKPNRRKFKRAGKAKKQAQKRPPLVDRRALERETWEVGRLIRDRQFASFDELNAFIQTAMNGQTPVRTEKATLLDQAQDLMYQAWDSRGKQRVVLARRALDLSKDCADAYVLLAEEGAESINEVRYFYEQGVKAGERALGEDVFREEAGHFWGIVETRPYMRARLGLAECLWVLGERQEAIAHYQELLRLNPNDNQGVRSRLLSCFLVENLNEHAEALLKQYDDDSADWQYSRALLAFRQRARNRFSVLKKAVAQNPYVPLYLLEVKELPKRMPKYIGFGDEPEAVDYGVAGLPLWRETEGAVEWLAQSLARLAAAAT